MNSCSRRSLLKTLTAAGICGYLPLTSRASSEVTTPATPFFINLSAHGGWDVASFCDPKLNIAGGKIINNWAKKSDIQQAGNIPFAPFGKNTDFFTQHFDKTLVINGINTHTNAHSVGRLTALTGNQKAGNPSLGTLYAATKGIDLPMPLLVGSTFETAGLIAPTQINSGLVELIKLNQTASQNSSLVPEEDLALINQDRQTITNANRAAYADAYYKAITTNDKNFPLCLNYLQQLEHGPFPNNRDINSLKFALSAFKAGLSLVFEYAVYGFDAHDNHDNRMGTCLSQLTTLASATWFYAEQLGISRQILLVMSSDFGRTPYYNDVGGKDHWPYTSVVAMQAGAPWANRVIGKTSQNIIGSALDSSLTNSNLGVELEPSHIHGSLRRHLGIADTTLAQKFPLNKTQKYDFFAGT
jgi:uncharacterized protein (DUF1501 family)